MLVHGQDVMWLNVLDSDGAVWKVQNKTLKKFGLINGTWNNGH